MEFKWIACMGFDHTSSKGGVEYSACFQHSLASWYGQSMHAFGIQDGLGELILWNSFYWS